MSLRSLILLVIGLFVATFVGINWAAMTAPTQLNLLIAEVEAPLGLVLLGLMVLLSVVFVGLIAYTQGTVLIETRRHAKELAAQRELADKAEASRFTDLRAHLDAEVARLGEAIAAQGREVLSRVDRAEMGLRERPVDAEIGHLARSLENLNRDLHSRVDRLEMGLRESLGVRLLPPLHAAEHAGAHSAAVPGHSPASAGDQQLQQVVADTAEQGGQAV